MTEKIYGHGLYSFFFDKINEVTKNKELTLKIMDNFYSTLEEDKFNNNYYFFMKWYIGSYNATQILNEMEKDYPKWRSETNK